MAKLSIFSAVFAALIAISAATTYTTTTVVTEINGPDEQSCQSEIQRVKMNQCIRYVGVGMGISSEYEPSFLRSEVADPKQEEEEERLQADCCNELRSVSPDCRGDAVRHVMKEMKRKYSAEHAMDAEAQKMVSDKVRQQMDKCNLKPRAY